MVWLLIDAENFFNLERESYEIKKGSKGIQEHANKIHSNELLLIYDVSRRQIEQIYIAVEDGIKGTGNDEYPSILDIAYVSRLDNLISFEEMKKALPNSEYVKDPRGRAIAHMTPNEWKLLRKASIRN